MPLLSVLWVSHFDKVYHYMLINYATSLAVPAIIWFYNDSPNQTYKGSSRTFYKEKKLKPHSATDLFSPRLSAVLNVVFSIS